MIDDKPRNVLSVPGMACIISIWGAHSGVLAVGPHITRYDNLFEPLPYNRWIPP